MIVLEQSTLLGHFQFLANDRQPISLFAIGRTVRDFSDPFGGQTLVLVATLTHDLLFNVLWTGSIGRGGIKKTNNLQGVSSFLCVNPMPIKGRMLI